MRIVCGPLSARRARTQQRFVPSQHVARVWWLMQDIAVSSRDACSRSLAFDMHAFCSPLQAANQVIRPELPAHGRELSPCRVGGFAGQDNL